MIYADGYRWRIECSGNETQLERIQQWITDNDLDILICGFYLNCIVYIRTDANAVSFKFEWSAMIDRIQEILPFGHGSHPC
jgi:hypothetical protein